MIRKVIIIFISSLFTISGYGKGKDSTKVYTRRVLETVEIDFLTSYYAQEGKNAAVSGGIGNEHLTDATATLIIAIPLTSNSVLSIDAGISAYTSASSSNVNPWDGNVSADAFVASSGASSGDLWRNITGGYSYTSEDRNNIWSAKISTSSEEDYSSFGFGGSYARLFNEKNTELSISGNVYLDTWRPIYPVEFGIPYEEDEDDNFDITKYTITGNTNYKPSLKTFTDKGRNSYSLGFGFSQILSERLQISLALDVIDQRGLLSTPFQRVYFSDIANSYIQNFHLADDIERLPVTRFKMAIGGRANYYINGIFVLRTFYRYYNDDWGINSHTASIELPVKLSDKFTFYPYYRYYNQSKANYFAPYEKHISTSTFYSSDYDLSGYNANQFGLGVSYTDILTALHLWKIRLKSVDLRVDTYQRSTGLSSYIISGGIKLQVK